MTVGASDSDIQKPRTTNHKPAVLPERLALISDIHANIEALDAVLADIDQRGIKEIWCLGDIVGYGPSPVECLLAVRSRCSFVLMGNHDYAMLRLPLHFNRAAASAIKCHVQLLREWCATTPNGWDMVKFLEDLPLTHKIGDVTFVHSSPRDPLWEYLFVHDAYDDPDKLDGVFDFIERVCFCGHTHYPGAVMRASNGEYASMPAEGDGFPVTLPVDWKAYVNIGSVGQPRDRDTRACYAELHGSRVIFHRIEYDYRKTMARIAELPIDPRCATRLAEGR
jgi:diadenosine tetraphosphatase ApaH/serine/threonine PP2A family protein phosphatase